MKLHWSPRSPFVRKVMIVVHELGIVDDVECLRNVASMTAPNEAIMADSPLAKIPVLVLDDGSSLFDSRVICEFLADYCGNERIYPRGPDRFGRLRLQALGDGLLDILVLWNNERWRPAEIRSGPHLDGFELRTGRTLDFLQGQASELSLDGPDVGDITIFCALSYLDFRFPELDWRRDHAALGSWHRAFGERPSCVATAAVDDR